MNCPECNREMVKNVLAGKRIVWSCDYCGTQWTPTVRINKSITLCPKHKTPLDNREEECRSCLGTGDDGDSLFPGCHRCQGNGSLIWEECLECLEEEAEEEYQTQVGEGL